MDLVDLVGDQMLYTHHLLDDNMISSIPSEIGFLTRLEELVIGEFRMIMCFKSIW